MILKEGNERATYICDFSLKLRLDLLNAFLQAFKKLKYLLCDGEGERVEEDKKK